MATPQRLVILGTGWGSYSFLRNINIDLFKVTVISPRNHFLFTPLLASTTVGTLEFRSIIQPVRDKKFENKVDFRLGSKVISCDYEHKSVHCVSVLKDSTTLSAKIETFSVPYDRLVVGVGMLSNTFGVKGVKEHALFLKEITDARNIRNRLLSNFERACMPDLSEEDIAKLLHVVIVGGGPTGVEFGAELYDFINQDIGKLFRKTKRFKVQVTLVEAVQILSSFDKRLRLYAEKKIVERENFHLVKSQVVEVRSDSVLLQDGQILPCGLVVWSTGLAPQTFVKNFDVLKNKQGQILVDDHLRILSDRSSSSYALGDCSHIANEAIPCTAQAAERQGKYLADYLNAEARGQVKKLGAFRFNNRGMLAYIGGYEGLTDLPDFKIKGITSWFLWRSAYLTRLGSWRLRLQVPLDWLKTLLFGRDTSRFE